MAENLKEEEKMKSINEILQQEAEDFLCLSSEESEEHDLSFWEFINPSGGDSDDDPNIDKLSLDSGLCVSWHSSLSSSAIIIPENAQFDAVFYDAGVGCVEEVKEDVSYVRNQYHYDEYDDCHDPDLDDDGYDLDDELVPRSVSGKLGREDEEVGKNGFCKDELFQEVSISVCEARCCSWETWTRSEEQYLKDGKFGSFMKKFAIRSADL